MKLIHLTAKRFQSLSADNLYIKSLAGSFSRALGKDYLLVAGSLSKDEFRGINTIDLNLFSKGTGLVYFLFPYFVYFFWLPYFLLFKVNTDSKTNFFLSDPYILCILIMWRRILFLEFKIVSDWHMLHNDWKENFIANNSDALIATSKKLKGMLIERTEVPGERIEAVYGGVDGELFSEVNTESIRKKYGLPLDKKIVAYVGLFKTMGMEKGIDTMLYSLKNLSENIVMLFVGGKIKEIGEYSSIAREVGVEGQVIFMEKIEKREEVYNIERAVDVLVIPYPNQPHFRNYGFPMKVYEYMAARKPIVYSKLELAEEILQNCGFTFIPDNSRSLADTLKYVLAEDNRREVREKVSLAFEKVKDLTWDYKAGKILEFIRKNG